MHQIDIPVNNLNIVNNELEKTMNHISIYISNAEFYFQKWSEKFVFLFII